MLVKGLIETPTVSVLQYLTIIHRNYDGGGNRQIPVAADDSGGWRQRRGGEVNHGGNAARSVRCEVGRAMRPIEY
jgi:hypothetical protein